MFIEILFKMLLFKGGVLIYAEHCIYIYIYIYIHTYIYIYYVLSTIFQIWYFSPLNINALISTITVCHKKIKCFDERDTF